MKLELLVLFISTIALTSAQVGPYPSAGAHPRQPRVRSSNGFTHTNAWFSNWNLNEGTNPIQTYPYVVRILIMSLSLKKLKESLKYNKRVVKISNRF